MTIYRLEVVDYQYPQLELEIECMPAPMSARWAAIWRRAWGPAPVMSGLVRTAIGPFRLADALQLPRLTPDSLAARCTIRSPPWPICRG